MMLRLLLTVVVVPVGYAVGMRCGRLLVPSLHLPEEAQFLAFLVIAVYTGGASFGTGIYLIDRYCRRR
jgi:hypothetical protein